MPRFRKKPVVIEAVLWTGSNFTEITQWADDVWSTDDDDNLLIYTLEGVMQASPGDWIIRGVQGEHYPCKPDIFEQTYEPAEDGEVEQPLLGLATTLQLLEELTARAVIGGYSSYRTVDDES